MEPAAILAPSLLTRLKVNHLDFSCDGQYLQCDSQKGGDLLFFDTERCETHFGNTGVMTTKIGRQEDVDALQNIKWSGIINNEPAGTRKLLRCGEMS